MRKIIFFIIKFITGISTSVFFWISPLNHKIFDHAVKDPVADDIPIHPSARILIFEGNYLSLGSGATEWREAAKLMDELWFVDVDFHTAKRRLVSRHIQAGLADNEESAARRAEENDLVNGKQIVDGRLEVHEVVKSQEDENWTSQSQGKHT